MSDEELDARLALFNRSSATVSSCGMSREGDVVFLKDESGSSCKDSRLTLPELTIGRPAFLAIPNRLTVRSELVEKLDPRAVLAVISHELSHYYGAHLMKLDPDFDRFYAAEPRGSRGDSKPAFGGADDADPRIREAWQFNKAFSALAVDLGRTAGSGFEIAMLNSTMNSQLDRLALSHYDYALNGGAFPLDLARLLLNAIQNAPDEMSPQDKLSHEPRCQALLAKYLEPQSPLQRFLFGGERDSNAAALASDAVGALWLESAGCLDAPFANSGSLAGLSQRMDLYDSRMERSAL